VPLPAPWFIALALLIGLLVTLPARRLHLGGLPRGIVASYAVVLWMLAMVMAVRPIGGRFVLPFLLVLYLAPFVAGPDRLRRLVRRPPHERRPPMKDVTPPDQRLDS